MRRFAVVFAMTWTILQAGPVTPAEGTHHESAATPQLTLNAGQKWPADKHTADSVVSMRSTVGNVPPGASVEELRAAAKRLQEQLQELIRGCTMNGPAHDQLHTWISQLAPEIQALMNVEQAGTGHASIRKISELLDAFDAHFVAQAP